MRIRLGVCVFCRKKGKRKKIADEGLASAMERFSIGKNEFKKRNKKRKMKRKEIETEFEQIVF